MASKMAATSKPKPLYSSTYYSKQNEVKKAKISMNHSDHSTKKVLPSPQLTPSTPKLPDLKRISLSGKSSASKLPPSLHYNTAIDKQIEHKSSERIIRKFGSEVALKALPYRKKSARLPEKRPFEIPKATTTRSAIDLSVGSRFSQGTSSVGSMSASVLRSGNGDKELMKMFEKFKEQIDLKDFPHLATLVNKKPVLTGVKAVKKFDKFYQKLVKGSQGS